MNRPLLSAFALLALAFPLRAADTGFLDKTYKAGDGKESKYVLFVPHNYAKRTATPTILFLHGAGETAGQKNGKMPVEVGIGPAIKKREKEFAFLTIIPQAPRFGWNEGSEGGKLALAILADVAKAYSVDEKRTYLTGLSMGGYGTWSIAAAHPEKFAAIAPVCGGVFNAKDVDSTAEKVKNIPCWCFHGDQDKAVKVEKSRELIAAMKKAGGKPEPKYTEYPGVEHNSWDRAYGTDELYTWLLEQKRK